MAAEWDCDLNGKGFMLSTLDTQAPFEFRSYEVQSVPIALPRIDNSEEPGEQTLGQWWTRAQHSWHLGIGQEILDAEGSSRFKVTDMFGLDPWTEGVLTNGQAYQTRINPNDTSLKQVRSIGTHAGLIVIHPVSLTNTIRRWVNPDSAADNLTIGPTSGANYITYDGELVYIAYAGDTIRSLDPSTFSSLTVVNNHSDVDVIGYVKGRLMGAKANQLFEYDLSDTAVPEPFFIESSTDWVFTAITESGPAIYFSGFSGHRSEIYAARLTAQDIPFASVATVGAPRSVWEAPRGETINHIKGYVGQQLLIATSRGVRVGNIVSEEGDLSVGPLIAETDKPCLWIEPWEDIAYFGWGVHDNIFGNPEIGIARIDLGDLSYAPDVFTDMNAGSNPDNFGNVIQITIWSNYDGIPVPVFGAQRLDAGGSIYVTNGRLASGDLKTIQRKGAGYFTIGEVWFGTTEKKRLKYFDAVVDHTSGVNDTWDLLIGLDGGALASVIADHDADGYSENTLTSQEASKFSMRIELHADITVNTAETISLRDWRFRGVPTASKRFRYLVPLMLYDFVVLGTGAKTGKIGLAWELLSGLESLYRNDTEFSFTPPESATVSGRAPVTVTMINLRFKEFAPPKGAEGFGGIALAVLEEVT